MEHTLPDKGWRGSADIWLDAAYAALVDVGVSEVKIMPLAQRLGLSRTSFYHHFTDRDALLQGLIERWQSKNTENLIARCHAPAATITEAMLNVIDCWITPELFDSRMEFAIRNWALSDRKLATHLVEVDEKRILALAAMFGRFGFAELEARVRSQTVYLTQIGYISMRTEEPMALRLARIPDYVRIFTGQAPSPDVLQAFVARHS